VSKWVFIPIFMYGHESLHSTKKQTIKFVKPRISSHLSSE